MYVGEKIGNIASYRNLKSLLKESRRVILVNDGINDSLVEANPIDTMEEDTKVNLVFDKEKLYKNMVDAKADWLYELPQWKEIFDDEKRRALFLEQKKSGTVHVGKKVGRNDPCPCGSGKKYKYCCGR